MIEKKKLSNIFAIFLFFHLTVWTLIPSLSNVNLPLDTIEAQERHERDEKIFIDD